MGNKPSAAGGKNEPPQHRQSQQQGAAAADKQAAEKLRHQEKIMLAFLDSVRVPVDDQIPTWHLLRKANLVQLKHLAHQSQPALESLGIKPVNATRIANGKPGEFEYLPTKLQASAVKRQSSSTPTPNGNGAAATSSAAAVRAATAAVQAATAAMQAESAAATAAVPAAKHVRQSTPPLPAAAPPQRLSKFIKGDRVEHYRESDKLLRQGKVVGVHLDDPDGGPYYTLALDSGVDLQCVQAKLEFVGGWEAKLEQQRRDSLVADEDLL